MAQNAYRRAARRTILLPALVLLWMPFARGQYDTDSLWSVWADGSRTVDARVEALDLFARHRYGRTDPDSVLICAQLMHDLAVSRGAPAHQGKALALRASGHLGKGEADPAIVLLDSAIALFEAAGTEQDVMRALNAEGRAHAMRGDLARATEGLTRALKIAEAQNDSSMTARILGNIGAMYHERGDLDHAMDYYQRRLVMAEALDQKDILGEVICNMAIIQYERGENEMALANYARALALSREIGHHGLTANTLHNMATVYQSQGRLPQALELFEQELALGIEIGDEACESSGRTAVAETQFLMGEPGKALTNAQKSLELAEKNGDIMLIRDAAQVLFKVRKAMGNGSEALRMHELYIAMRDSVKSEENQAAMLTQKFQYDYEKKEALLLVEQEKKDAVAAETIRRKNVQRNAFIGGFGLMILLAGVFFTQRNRIGREKARSEELLLNILPEEVADELKEKGHADAKHFDTATILFTDFKGFTQLSEQVSPAELVEELNTCFKAFDGIMGKHRIEKIKTIGDAYMAAGGLPDPMHGSPAEVVRAALEMQEFMAAYKAQREAEGRLFFQMRVGIHTGPVIAGIVGVKKFQYDIWGDTVNTASRMESSGEVGRVNISEATYALVKDTPGLAFSSRGKVQAKGKGEMEMYFVRRSSEGA